MVKGEQRNRSIGAKIETTMMPSITHKNYNSRVLSNEIAIRSIYGMIERL